MGFSIIQRDKTTFLAVLLDTYPSHKTFCYFTFISCLPRGDLKCQITGITILVGTFCPYNVGNTRYKHTYTNKCCIFQIIGFFWIAFCYLHLDLKHNPAWSHSAPISALNSNIQHLCHSRHSIVLSRALFYKTLSICVSQMLVNNSV